MLLSKATELATGFDIRSDGLGRITHQIVQQLRADLARDGPTQIPSFVTNVPNGLEKGHYLAIDLGGTNCRVCLVKLHGNGTYTLNQSKRAVPEEARINSSHKPLFSFIATQLKEFLSEVKLEMQDTKSLKLGFTFSFTYKNVSLSKGVMLQWDKGWDIPNAIGKDPCKMLQDAIDEADLPVRVVALTNDSVGTLMSRAYTSPGKSDTLLGAIFGTGTNGAYIERRSLISKLVSSSSATSDTEKVMVVNTEWGAMCDSLGLLHMSACDAALDAASKNPGLQLLEKQISGLYLGELLRLAIVDLLEQGLFAMVVPKTSLLFRPYAVDASFLAGVTIQGTDKLEMATQHITASLAAQLVSGTDTRAIAILALAILQRSARLSATAIAAVIIQSGRLVNRSTSTPEETTDVAYLEGKVTMRPTDQEVNHSVWGSSIMSSLRRFISCFNSGGDKRRLKRDTKKAMPPDNVYATKNIIDIGVDGSLFEFCPQFEIFLRIALREIAEIGIAGEKRIRIGLAKDGSSVGAALVAASTEQATGLV